MLEKFISIKNVGRFRNSNAKGDTALNKLSLFYGENARGKTTLCSVLRSLATGKNEFIQERKTLGVQEAQFIDIRLNSSNFTFSNGVWNSTYEDILIFDQVFINENIYAGDHIEHDHKRNLYRVVIGQKGVLLAEKIDNLAEEIKDATRLVNSAKDKVLVVLPKGMNLDTFLKLEEDKDVLTNIAKAKDELSKQRLAQQQSTEIKQRPYLQKISLPTFPSNFIDLMTKNLDGIMADAESKIKKQIEMHDMGNHGEAWLAQGINYTKERDCPFCGAEINNNDLIKAYKSHFNNSYRTAKDSISRMEGALREALDDTSMNSIMLKISENARLLEFWIRFRELPKLAINTDDIKTKFQALLNKSIDILNKKMRNIAEHVSIDDEFQKYFNEFSNLSTTVSNYNSVVDTINDAITKQKKDIDSVDSVSKIENEIVILEAKQKRHEAESVKIINEYVNSANNKKKLETEKDKAKEDLDTYCESVLSNYEKSINLYLSQFQVGFRIVNTKHQYVGGKPSSEYQIAINGVPISVGTQKVQPGTPCFKTILSSGDKSALALAFFLGVLDQEPNLNRKIIVFDDPFTSQDCFRRTCTQQAISRLALRAEQVIVFSHEPQFIFSVKENSKGCGDIKTLRLSRCGKDVVIEECHIDYEVKSQYLKDYSKLKEFADCPVDTGLLDTARAIRPFLESYYRSRFPGYFLNSHWLGDFIEAVRLSAPADGLAAIKDDLVELEDINNFSKKYHHDKNPNADNEPISSDELLAFVNRTLNFVGHSYV